jgi:sec-independent protein translocase protein TatC
MSLSGHLEELRRRLIFCTVAVLGAAVLGFAFVDKLRWILTRPAGNLELVFISPPEALMANFRLAFIAGLILAMPFVLYQFMAFVLPALYKHEKKVIIPVVFMMVLFFFLGAAFAYFIAFPLTIRFLMKFSSDAVSPMFTISKYLTFATTFIFAFGLVFQMPLVFYALGRLRVVNARFLRTYRKHALLLVLVISALLTPPDVLSQLMMAVPLMLLYELGIMLVVLSQGKAERGQKERNNRLMS